MIDRVAFIIGQLVKDLGVDFATVTTNKKIMGDILIYLADENGSYEELVTESRKELLSGRRA